jgi:hypothetical protein
VFADREITGSEADVVTNILREIKKDEVPNIIINFGSIYEKID